MKNWARRFNPRRAGYRTPAIFRLRKILKNQKIKTLFYQRHLFHWRKRKDK